MSMDGKYRGRTPLTLTSVSAGKHTIELDLAGYYDWTSTLSVSPGVTSSINAHLSSIPSKTTGAIDVVSYPAGAGVYTISNVQVGGHTVRVALSGYQDYTTSVNRQCCNHKSRHRDAPARSTLHNGLDLGHLLARGRPGLHR